MVQREDALYLRLEGKGTNERKESTTRIVPSAERDADRKEETKEVRKVVCEFCEGNQVCGYGGKMRNECCGTGDFGYAVW